MRNYKNKGLFDGTKRYYLNVKILFDGCFLLFGSALYFKLRVCRIFFISVSIRYFCLYYIPYCSSTPTTYQTNKA